MTKRTFCDRCTEPLRGTTYELFLLPHDHPHHDHYRGDLCEPCYRAIARAAGLPLKPVAHWHDVYPGFIDNMFGTLWKRLWKRR